MDYEAPNGDRYEGNFLPKRRFPTPKQRLTESLRNGRTIFI